MKEAKGIADELNSNHLVINPWKMSTNSRGKKGGDIYCVKHEAGKQVFSL